MTACSEIRPYLQAFVDDELSPERVIGIEQHLVRCAECASEVELTQSLCRTTRISVASTSMCPEFHARLCQSLSRERVRQEGRIQTPLSWRVITPLAFAAAVALFLGVRMDAQGTGAVVHAAFSPNGITQNGIVDFFVQNHASLHEPEMREQRAVGGLESRLGFPVRAPNWERFGARFEGANLVHIDSARVAMLHYSFNGRRFTVYIYDPLKLPLRAQQALEPRVVGNRAVFVGNRNGYAIAASELHGVGYAVTGDLSVAESAELVAAIHR